MVRRLAVIAMLAATGATLAACDLSMTQQRKLKTYAPTALWPDGSSARSLPDNVVAQGGVERAAAVKNPPTVTAELLARGQERFGIFCAPCHGLAGDGNFLVAAMVWLIPGAEAAQFYVIVLMTYLISAGGFMHIVAGSVEGFLLLLHGELGWLPMLTEFVIPVLTGNIVGGTALFALIAYAQVMKEI